MYDLCTSERESQFSILECAFRHGYLCTHISYHFIIVERIASVPQESVSHDSPSSSSSLSEFSGSTPSYGSGGDSDKEVSIPIQIDVHCEVMATENQPVPVQLVKNISKPVLDIAKMKQTAKKSQQQGKPAKYAGKVGKVVKQLAMQTAGVAMWRRHCKDHCPIMPQEAPVDASTGEKKRYHPGTKSLLEIAYYQK